MLGENVGLLAAVLIAAGVLGWFLRRDYDRAARFYRARQYPRLIARENSLLQNLHMMRACVREMRRDYSQMPSDKFVIEILGECDHIEDWLKAIEIETSKRELSERLEEVA